MWIKANNPRLDATKKPSAIDIAWAAGFWEGEGHVRVTRRRSLSVTAVQKSTEPLYKLREWFGGNVRFMRCATVPNEQQCYTWECCGDRARIFLALIYSFLSSRRKTQVDHSQALLFLGHESSEGMAIDKLKDRLLSYYEEDRKTKWSSPEFWKTEEYRKQNRESMRKRRGTKPQNFKIVSIAQEKVG